MAGVNGKDVRQDDLRASKGGSMNKKTWIIQDWTGREMNWGVFASFDEAWEAVYKRFRNEEDYQEYYATEVI